MEEFSFLGSPFKHVMHFCCFCEVRNIQKDVTHSWLAWCFLFKTCCTLWVKCNETCMFESFRYDARIQFYRTKMVIHVLYFSLFLVGHNSFTCSKNFTKSGPWSPERGCQRGFGYWRGRKHLTHCADAETTSTLVEKRWCSSAARNQYGPLRCANVDVVSVSRRANVVSCGLHHGSVGLLIVIGWKGKVIALFWNLVSSLDRQHCKTSWPEKLFQKISSNLRVFVLSKF